LRKGGTADAHGGGSGRVKRAVEIERQKIGVGPPPLIEAEMPARGLVSRQKRPGRCRRRKGSVRKVRGPSVEGGGDVRLLKEGGPNRRMAYLPHLG